MERQFDLIIIGSGPAGMSAAIYATRAGLSTLLLDNGAPGGKLLKTNRIENWPGMKTTPGPDLAYQMFDHATSFGAEYAYGDVVRIEEGALKRVETTDTVYHAKTIILASGTKERLLNVPGEQEFLGKGVSYCATCDGAFFQDKDVIVVGGGNTALEEANYLTKFAKNVFIFTRKDTFRAEEFVQKEVAANPKIVHYKNYEVERIVGNEAGVTSVWFRSTKDHSPCQMQADGIFPCIGADPATQCIAHLGVLNEFGYVQVDANMETKVAGLYAAGDCIEKGLRQVVTAVNDGAIAAQHAFYRIQNISHE
ncbi:MAG: thioredoxin-disulfide reductase [Erysipelotrichaceae bacterium]